MPHSTSFEANIIDDLVSKLSDAHNSHYGFGAMSCSVYDTAWVSSVTKTVAGVPQYLFPASFIAILNAQLADGSWDGHFTTHAHQNPNSNSADLSSVSSSTLADKILSTMAAIYAMNLHHNEPLQISRTRLPGPRLHDRIAAATSSLDTMLTQWNVDTCNAVGFEVLCPAMLGLLSSQGYDFDFPSKKKLFQIRDIKLARISPKVIYKLAPSALLHSLEAFHGWNVEDFDVSKVKHHLVGGSMMGSPAATASYLMKSPEWDPEAEAYLRMVVECGDGMGSGAVPSAYPSTNFEMLWVVSTLAEYGVWNNVKGTKKLDTILQAIEDTRSITKGLVGFAPGIEPDLDDSAKASIVFSLAGRPGFSAVIVEEFDSERCLKTYRGERDPGVSANCNALMSLLFDTHEFKGKTETIAKVVDFIIAQWTAGGRAIKDKWNLSPYYPIMLITKALAKVLTRWHSGRLSQISAHVIETQLAPLLVDSLQQTLRAQRSDGSWGSIGPYEETAYAVLTLINLVGLPLCDELHQKAQAAIEKGRDFLRGRGNTPCEYLWIEKITFGSQFLMDTYVLTALLADPEIEAVQNAPLHSGSTVSQAVSESMVQGNVLKVR
ncbi:hypothetical protein BU24DRAFT_458311 [Aaosphaeria arxii CBS 175.79]|uniref:Terpenoid cyclases/Protein prenyltransferase n=1 Tax=Aaosphaeria arxii CBS 175.79 TaxID=1450172 RepID=A0A6A5Y0U7_9PLEO|nr:uncharacterized protein BU24DRAFT_458311 [Aaosphaeria arxii CBS 175.79]KAF2018551.1 hypothetical protein BU24DRAFT_458311 [Aaosphaeria arxii CBS 175.79]